MGLTTSIGMVWLLGAIIFANVLYDATKALGVIMLNKIEELKAAKKEVRA